jgi:hypothetical protein
VCAHAARYVPDRVGRACSAKRDFSLPGAATYWFITGFDEDADLGKIFDPEQWISTLDPRY